MKISSPRCQCIRRLVESVLPTTRKANGALQTNGATAADVRALIDHARHTVHERFGVLLEPEVKLIESQGEYLRV